MEEPKGTESVMTLEQGRRLTLTCPSASARKLGSTRTVTFSLLSMSTYSRICAPVADGIASSTVSTAKRFIIVDISFFVPRTLSDATVLPSHSGATLESVSTNALRPALPSGATTSPTRDKMPRSQTMS